MWTCIYLKGNLSSFIKTSDYAMRSMLWHYTQCNAISAFSLCAVTSYMLQRNLHFLWSPLQGALPSIFFSSTPCAPIRMCSTGVSPPYCFSQRWWNYSMRLRMYDEHVYIHTPNFIYKTSWVLGVVWGFVYNSPEKNCFDTNLLVNISFKQHYEASLYGTFTRPKSTGTNVK